MKKNMKIASVKLLDGGMKGIEVKYAYTTIKNNRSFTDEVKEKKKAPVQEELEICFGQLKDHLLNICGYTVEETERKYLLSQLSIVAVDYSEKGLIIEGSMAIMDGDKFLSLKTPLIENNIEYPEFGEALAIVSSIFAETKEYMEGKKMMSDEQIVLKANKGTAGFDPSVMSKDDFKIMATEFLEKECGSSVFHQEDFQVEGTDTVIAEEAPEPVTETPKMEVVKEEPSVAGEPITETPLEDDFSLELDSAPVPETPAAEKIKKGKALTAKVKTEAVIHDDGDFSLGLDAPAEKPVSTAKRKTA